MPSRPLSPYLAPGFYDDALARGRHRDIVGGRWEETGRLQMVLLQAEGMEPKHRLLDIGCGALRLGCKAVPYLDPGNYWGTDASLALMQRGWEVELGNNARLPLSHLVEDAKFALPGIPAVDYAIAFGVFTHLPIDRLGQVLLRLRDRAPALRALLFTAFLGTPTESLRQRDGVVTHPDRPPWHVTPDALQTLCAKRGFDLHRRPDLLPRGQILFVATMR